MENRHRLRPAHCRWRHGTNVGQEILLVHHCKLGVALTGVQRSSEAARLRRKTKRMRVANDR